jgi:ComF family protein
MFLIAHCALCGLRTRNRQILCVNCKTDLPWIVSSCFTCGLPLPDAAEQFQCGECLVGNSPFSLAVTPLLYQKPVASMVTAFKHHRSLAQGRLLAQLLGEEIHDRYMDIDLPEVIIPVPLHWRRFMWRGYNQSAELGRQLGRQLHIPCQTNLLTRVRHTASQQGLSREQRLHNLTAAFQLSGKMTFKRIAVLDDVVTTGSTAATIARLLLQQGAEEIHLWAVARTPQRD